VTPGGAYLTRQSRKMLLPCGKKPAVSAHSKQPRVDRFATTGWFEAVYLLRGPRELRSNATRQSKDGLVELALTLA
jgi:hypothetical protein